LGVVRTRNGWRALTTQESPDFSHGECQTSKQAAQILDCTTRYVTELCKQGKFPGAAQDARGRWRIPQESVVALLATKRNTGGNTVGRRRTSSCRTKKAFLRELLDAEVFAEVLRNTEEYQNMQKELEKTKKELAVTVEKLSEIEDRNKKEVQNVKEWVCVELEKKKEALVG